MGERRLPVAITDGRKMSYKDGVHRLTQFGRICLLIVVATLVAGPHNPARAQFKSVSECQRSGDSNSEPGLLARIECYKDVMSAISFQREKTQHLSDMI